MDEEEKSVGGIVVNSEGKYLLLCRADKGDNLWEFPKGHQKPGETDYETLTRELKEETGIVDFELADGFVEYNRYINSRGIRRLIVLYLIKIRNNLITLSSEHKEYAWLDYDSAIKRLNHHNWIDIIEKAKAFQSKK